jgi:hypothetical protein
VISTVDPDARHTRKSPENRRDGYRAHHTHVPRLLPCRLAMIRDRAAASRTPDGAGCTGRAPARSQARQLSGTGATQLRPKQSTSRARNAQAEPPCIITRYR